MSKINSIKLTVSRIYNLKNYENIRIEACADSIRENDTETEEDIRCKALSELQCSLDALFDEHFPKKG